MTTEPQGDPLHEDEWFFLEASTGKKFGQPHIIPACATTEDSMPMTPTRATLECRGTLGRLRSINPSMINHFAYCLTPAESHYRRPLHRRFPITKLEQLECLRSEDTPCHPMITVSIDQFILDPSDLWAGQKHHVEQQACKPYFSHTQAICGISYGQQ